MVQYQTWLNNNNKNSEFDWNIIQLIKRKKKKKRHLTALLLRDRKEEAETKTNRFLAYTQTTKQSFLKIFTRDRKAKLKKNTHVLVHEASTRFNIFAVWSRRESICPD